VVSLQAEFDGIFKSLTKIPKVKSAISEGIAQSQTTTQAFHRERRIFIAGELQMIRALCSEPLFVCEQFQVCVAAMRASVLIFVEASSGFPWTCSTHALHTV
jgi:vancomycin permeability regulator SanA